MAAAPTELPLPDELSSDRNSSAGPRFPGLRGVRWRINLGILPQSPSASIEELRRVTADSRRRYASLRRRLLIDPHLSKDGSRSPDPTWDNPLSQSPDSIWGRFFRNAELEKMVEQDLSRLYPEHGGYFQTLACQTMLRRILLLWCLRHPEYGYRQGMHELLAPLLYVLHIDLQHLSQVQGHYEDLFNDEFDESSSTKADDREVNTDDGHIQKNTMKVNSLDELDPGTRDIFSLNDAYGAEGELGVIISERFMEHDAYCMFDSLMNGARGVVAMADLFAPSAATGSSTGMPPVIEASSALYHLLSVVDPSLHSHLVELGVEPQYFSLRWLRVLFGREFSLDDLLVIWDELFSFPNTPCTADDTEYKFRILCSPRGAFISAIAVSMLLHVRSSLFATENATSCLQRLLSFPSNIDVKKLIEKAKSLQALALDANISSPAYHSPTKSKPALSRVCSLSSTSASPKTPLNLVPDSYWEEKWRVLHTEEALQKGSRSEKASGGIMKGSLVKKFGLSRTESDPSHTKVAGGKKDARSSVKRRLLDDLSEQIDSGANISKMECDGAPCPPHSEERLSTEDDVRKDFLEEPARPDMQERTSDCTVDETCLSAGNSSVFSSVTSPHSMGNDEENNSEKSSVTSNSFVADNDEEINQVEEQSRNNSDNSLHAATTGKLGPSTEGGAKHEAALKERKQLSGKFPWFWRFGRGSGEGITEKVGNADAQRSSGVGNICNDDVGGSTPVCDSFKGSGKSEGGEKDMKNIRQSLLENIQVIESSFQHARGHDGIVLGGDEQVATMAALKELRKISNLLSEM